MKTADEILARIHDTSDDDTVYWTSTHESSFVLVHEAYRRFLVITKDPRQAAGLTLAWSSIEGGYAARPE